MRIQPLVTVVITVYKRTEYLEIALKSVLNQTMTEFEIIIADDSGCKLVEPIYELYSHDKRIIYQSNSKTLGIVNSLKKAIERSRGLFISILNDDDCWEPNFLEKISHPLCINEDIVLAFCDHWIIDSNGNIDNHASDFYTKLFKRNEIKTGELPDPKKLALFYDGIPLAMASVFRKDAIDLTLLLPDVSGAYDFWMSCLLAATGKPFYYNSERLTRYRMHDQMETARRSVDKQQNSIYIFKTLLDLRIFPEYTTYIMKKYSFSIYKVGRDNLYFGNILSAREYFKQALKVKFDIRFLIAFGLSYLPKIFLENLTLLKKSDSGIY